MLKIPGLEPLEPGGGPGGKREGGPRASRLGRCRIGGQEQTAGEIGKGNTGELWDSKGTRERKP